MRFRAGRRLRHFAPSRAAAYNGRPFNHVPPAMTDALPDRLAVDPASRFHDADLLQRGIGIRFNGKERLDVEEYCVSEGWIKVAHGRARDRRGRPMLLMLRGTVEPYLLPLDADADAEADATGQAGAGKADGAAAAD